MEKMRNALRIVSFIGDYILLLLSLTIVIYTRTSSSNVDIIYQEYLRFFVPAFVIWLFLFFLFDLYNFDTPPRFTRFFLCLTICIVGTIIIFYIFPAYFIISPKTNLGIFGAVFAVLFYFWRLVIIENLFVYLLRGHEIMMAISDSDALELACKLHENPRYKYSVKGVLVNSEFAKAAEQRLPAEIIFTDAQDFEKAIIASSVQTIVSSSIWFTRLYGTMYELLPRNIRIINMINFHERVLGFIPVHSTSQFWIMTNVDLVSRRIYMVVKRILDIVFAVAILPLVVAVMLVVAVVIKIFGELKAPVLFKQKRVGRYNKEFMLYKFRTMRMDAEKEGKAVWASEKDPRVTKIGRMLRLTRLDELPQIFNILKGDMSFIGPRPERMEFVIKLTKEIPHYQLRHVIKPGLSGWAQVKFRYGSTVEDSAVKLCYDLFYIKNINLVLDIRILFRTIVTVFSAAGQ